MSRSKDRSLDRGLLNQPLLGGINGADVEEGLFARGRLSSTGGDDPDEEDEEEQLIRRRIAENKKWTLDRGAGYHHDQRLRYNRPSLVETGS